MSRTPAAAAARLKVMFPDWQITRTTRGWQAVSKTGVMFWQPTVAQLETDLWPFTGQGTGALADPRPRARGAGAHVP